MRAILKALGLTVWGLAAIGLLAILVFVGYETAIKHRVMSGALVAENTFHDRTETDQAGPSSGIPSSGPTTRANDMPRTSMPPRTPESTRQLMLHAARASQYESAIADGQKLAAENSAGPGDLLIIAQSYSSIGDCENARLWAQRSQTLYKAAGVVPDGSLSSVLSCCEPGRRNYELAITSIERGLSKGGIVHLAEAYVYLGLSKQRVGDIEGARDAFDKLKSVPNISPRVLKLWTLYAETQLSGLDNWDCSKGGRADHNSSSTGTSELSGSGR